MEAVGPILGLGAAAVYGASDFAGGAASRRVSSLWVLAVAQGTALVFGLVAVGLDRQSTPVSSGITRGALAGLLGVVALGMIYRGLAAGPMGVVASVATVAHALVPLAWGLAEGERPGPTALAGVVLAIAAVAVIARGEAASHPDPAQATGAPGAAPPIAHRARAGVGRAGLLFGLAGGATFGLVAVVLADVSKEAGMWPLVAWRAVSFPVALVALLVVRPQPGPARPIAGLAALAGALEVLGNGLYLIAAREGLLSLVGVLSSLNPISTVALAAIVLHERLRTTQATALVVALVGVLLIALG